MQIWNMKYATKNWWTYSVDDFYLVSWDNAAISEGKGIFRGIEHPWNPRQPNLEKTWLD